MFIPRTPGGRLITQLREIESNLAKTTKKSIRLVEESGIKLKKTLCKSDPWEQVQCGRESCTTCPIGRPGSCRTKNVVYHNICLPCKDMEVSSRYIGETARTMWERGAEHTQDSLNLSKNSHMRDHMMSSHQDLLEEMLKGAKLFTMQIIKPARSALSRQIREAVEIASNNTRGIILNSKDEFSRSLIPCIQIDGPKNKPKAKYDLNHPDEHQAQTVNENEEESSIMMTRDKKRYRKTLLSNNNTQHNNNNNRSKRRKIEPYNNDDEDSDKMKKTTSSNQEHNVKIIMDEEDNGN